MIGCALTILWRELDWRHIAIAVLLIAVIRPAAGWLGLWGTGLRPREASCRGGLAGLGRLVSLRSSLPGMTGIFFPAHSPYPALASPSGATLLVVQRASDGQAPPLCHL